VGRDGVGCGLDTTQGLEAVKLKVRFEEVPSRGLPICRLDPSWCLHFQGGDPYDGPGEYSWTPMAPKAGLIMTAFRRKSLEEAREWLQKWDLCVEHVDTTQHMDSPQLVDRVAQFAIDRFVCMLLRPLNDFYWYRVVYQYGYVAGEVARIAVVQSHAEPRGCSLEPPPLWWATGRMLKHRGVQKWPTIWERVANVGVEFDDDA